ncbi:MAG: VWA domain-containing protein, partial [Sandaracinaceae bacterium]
MRRPDPRLFLLLTAALAGCGGVASASRQRTRYAVSQGALPQVSEIRVAEYLADYPESFPDPGPHVGAGLTLEGARAAWGGEEQEPLVVVQAGVRGRSAEVRRPVALMFVVDRSGSMNEADKMTFVRRGLHTLIGSLDPQDAVGIVAFDNAAEVLSPLTEVGHGAHLSAAIDRLEPRGGTNLSGGLDAGYAELDR